MRPSFRGFVAGLLLGLLSFTQAVAGPGSREVDFDVPQLPLTDFLEVFGQQAGVQYGYVPESNEEEQILVGPLRGRYTISAAVALALRPIGFTVEWVNGSTLSVVRLPAEATSLAPVPLEPERLPQKPPQLPYDTGQPERSGLDGVLVVGTRLFSFPEMQLPLVTLDRQAIEALGVATLSEVLHYVSQQPYSRAEGHRTSGEQQVELRGLGADTTLVLINGRRVGATSTSFDTNAFDLNTIPLTAVERIEILLDETPFAVGADAIGGMVNIVLRNHFSEPSVELRYGSAAGGAEERRFSLADGTSSERLKLSAVLDYFDRQHLLGEERERWRNQDYRRYGGEDFRSPTANPGNVYSLNGQNLPGLPSPVAAVPPHAPGAVLSVQDFLATSGTQNLESLFRYRSILPEAQRASVVGSLQWSWSPTVLTYAEILYTHRETLTRDLPASIVGIVPPTNPYNPFGVPVRSNFLLTGMDTRELRTDADFARGVLGAQGAWNRWSWEMALLQTYDVGRVESRNELDPAQVAAALASSDTDHALNVFDDGPGGNASVLQSLLADPVTRRYGSDSVQASVLARGPITELSTGTVTALLGGEWRRAKIEIDGTSLGTSRRIVRGAFAEVGIPLVGGAQRIPGIQELSLSVAGRVDELSDLRPQRHAQARLLWRPARDLTVRATYGSGYRLPSLHERYQPIETFPFGFADPKRRNEIANVTVSTGGNPQLKEATSHAWAVGLSWAPRALPQARIEGKVWRVAIRDRINPILLPELLAHESLLPARVIRAEATPEDEAAGRPGALQHLDVTPGNVGTLDARGVDGSGSLSVDTAAGRLTASLAASWVARFMTSDLPGTAAAERVAIANVLGTIPRWRAVASFGWERGGVSAIATTRLLSRYEDVDLLTGEKSSRVIGCRALLDLQASLRLDSSVSDASVWQGVRLTLGVNDVFDQAPPFAQIGGIDGFDTSQGDLKGRFGYLRVTKKF